MIGLDVQFKHQFAFPIWDRVIKLMDNVLNERLSKEHNADPSAERPGDHPLGHEYR
jgi:hypothetical protein